MIDLDFLSGNTVWALGSMLVHFVWQGAVVAIILAVTRLFMNNPLHRYAVSCAAMGGMVLMAAVTLTLTLYGSERPLPVLQDLGPGAGAMTASPSGGSLLPFSDYAREQSKVSTGVDRWTRFAGDLQRFTPEIVGLWLMGILALSLRLLGGCWVCYRLRHVGIRDLPDQLTDGVESLIDRMHIRQKVRVFISAKAAVPMVVGILRPVILFPASSMIGLTPDQLQAILVHELAHVRRYDNLVNLLQHVVETTFFYHPAVWWVSRCIRVEREHCCDDAAAAASDPRSYAGALAALEELRGPRLAAAATDGSLLQRVRRLLALDTSNGIDHKRSAVLGYIAPVLVALVVATVVVRGAQAEEVDVTVDVTPALPHAGTTLASCMTPMMQLLSGPEWSMARIQGVMGHAFYFPMKEGAGSVMHDDIDWGIAMKYLKGFGVSKRFDSTKNSRKKKKTDLPAYKAKARDAVRVSLDKGVPALVWQPMSVEQKSDHGHAYCWGLIVGYNEADETYSIRHPFVEDTYTVRYDLIGHADGAEWFSVKIFDKPTLEDERSMHLSALENAVAFANATRFEKKKKHGVYGLASYDVWRSAFDAEDVLPEKSGWHSKVLRERRAAARDYVKELAEFFPEAANPLNAAATHYEREVKILIPLREMCSASSGNTLTSGERAQAQQWIGQALEAEQAAIAQIKLALGTLGVKTEEANSSKSGLTGDSAMNVAVDVTPAKPHYGSSLVACLNPIMQTAGRDEWTMARLQGVMGHAFHFEMRKGAGTVYHDAPDWSFALHHMDALGTFKTVNVLHKDTETDRPARRREARDAVVAGLKRGMPALVWSPLSPEIKAGPPPHPVCWGLIVGYNEDEETYTVRHPWMKDQYTVRYDRIGHKDGDDWLNVRVLEEPSDTEDKAVHAEALRTALAFANGTQYSDKSFTRPNGKKVKPYGFAAYETWREAFDSGEELGSSPNRQEHNANMLKFKRQAAADYLRELAAIFPEAAESLEAGAGHYDREQKTAHSLSHLFDSVGERESMTDEERTKAAKLIAEALESERAAVAQIEVALAVMDGA